MTSDAAKQTPAETAAPAVRLAVLGAGSWGTALPSATQGCSDYPTGGGWGKIGGGSLIQNACLGAFRLPLLRADTFCARTQPVARLRVL